MRTLRVYYESAGGEMLCYEHECSWQAADAALNKLRPREYLRPNAKRGHYVSYSHGENDGLSGVIRVEIIHPDEPIPVTRARLIVLPSQMAAS